MSASSSSGDPGTGSGNAGGVSGSAGGSQGPVKKTNVCLICGIYTNLSLNIFEPRTGPNIREVIYKKYNFRAERSDNEDKYICYSCNNWLINWYSLQHLSESRNYESTPSSSRSQSENRQKRTKNERSHANPSLYSSKDKENVEQDSNISSTVNTLECKTASSPKRKSKQSTHRILKDSDQQNLISSTTNTSNLVKPVESRLIRMLENQGTSVFKENVKPTGNPNYQFLDFSNRKRNSKVTKNKNEVILSFNSAISEVVDSVPSLKSLYCNEPPEDVHSAPQMSENFLKTRRLSQSLSISLINNIASATSQKE